jgi:hypothetical protein
MRSPLRASILPDRLLQPLANLAHRNFADVTGGKSAAGDTAADLKGAPHWPAVHPSEVHCHCNRRVIANTRPITSMVQSAVVERLNPIPIWPQIRPPNRSIVDVMRRRVRR